MNIKTFTEEIKKSRDFKEVAHHELIAARSAVAGPWPRGISAHIREGLSQLGLKNLYCHQSEGIEALLAGGNIVIMTPTASGKSLIYQIPVLAALEDDPSATALYISPLKGLLHDQQRAFGEIAKAIRGGTQGNVKGAKKRGRPIGISEIYDGDTSSYRRKKIRENPPALLLTNPDMLHLSINAYNRQWESFIKKLRYVVIDEVHTYRGVFGSHVANVFHRFMRILNHYGVSPRFICCSATIANAVELAGMLTGLDYTLISKNGAPSGKGNFLFINPVSGQSPYTVATKLFTRSIANGFRTIAFTRARKITELMHSWVVQGAPELRDKVSAYRAGFLPEERRLIEKKLFSGQLQGVISTSALELGVDIGGLDVCILVGYPGSVNSTWQRGGRAGRSGRDSLIALVALEDALDQYFMRNPEDFFRRSVEAAVLDMDNPVILKPHLLCAATETKLQSTDSVYDIPAHRELLNSLQSEGKLRYWEKGDIWYPRTRNPQRDFSIRASGYPYRILTESGKLIGESGAKRVFHELHPGAVYMHLGALYKVTKLDMGNHEARVVPADDIYYHTTAITEEETKIISIDLRKWMRSLQLFHGSLRVTEKVTGYRRKEISTETNLGEFPLILPPTVFTTKGIWMEVDDDLLEEVREKGFSVGGALHALEHAAIAALPLYALCDRMDLGGMSYPFNPELGRAAIFIYDGHEGGVGLSERGFHFVEAWFRSTLKLMDECPCEVSCPSCTQDPWCGNGNEPLDKRGAILILKKWLGQEE